MQGKDLTEGKPFKLLLWFTLPVLIGGVFQQLYSLADTLIVGQTVSMNALAAVGSTGSVTFLLQGLALGLTSGFAVLTAQKFGAKDEEMVKKSIATSIGFGFVLSVVLTLVSVFTVRPVLRLMKSPAETFELSAQYLTIIYLGFGATIFYNMFAQILRALGDSKTPLYFLIFTTVLNVGLDLLLILVFGLGVQGAALATVVAQALSALLTLLFALWKYPAFRTRKEHWRLDWRYLWAHVRIGLPMAFMFSITAMGHIILQTELNSLGRIVMAAYAAASKVEQLITQMLVSVGVATATFTAQNFGAKKYGRVKQGVKGSLFIQAILSVLAFFVLYFAGRYCVRLFINTEEITAAELTEVIRDAQIYFAVNAPFYFLLALIFVFRNVLQGIGKSFGTMLAGIAELILRYVAVSALGSAYGFKGVCFSNPLAWAGADLVQITVYLLSMRGVFRALERDAAAERLARAWAMECAGESVGEEVVGAESVYTEGEEVLTSEFGVWGAANSPGESLIDRKKE